MYITTFYSFKGGVGRTLALVNVAVELSRSGRRVLLVDFDLEAPGLHTFDSLKPSSPNAGIVEFVTEFLATLKAPAVSPYVYEIDGVHQGTGRLWVMPSGKGDEAYRSKLAAINWRDLYNRFDGYLLFEDLKTQWQEVYQPDYVLIDSRTGHTEIEGICTRHLPDAVVCLFFPNEQNLVGLQQVVADIRAEAEGPRKKKTQLHFVMSNVPDLDDEEEILTNRMKKFQDQLGYKELTATIHHFENLALLNQVIFTQSRPKSRLAREYKVLKEAIVAENIEDREGAVRFLKDNYNPRGFALNLPKEEVENRLGKILTIHDQDAEILLLLAKIRKDERSFEEALDLLDQAITHGKSSGETLLERADVRQQLKDVSGAVSDVKNALNLPNLGAVKIDKAIRMLIKLVDETALRQLSSSPSIIALDINERILVANRLQWDRRGLLASSEILTKVLNTSGASDEVKLRSQIALSLCLIGLGRFTEVIHLFETVYPNSVDDVDICWAFNYAMAEWGKTGHTSRDSFARVIQLYRRGKTTGKIDEANFFQCLSLAFWAIEEFDEARRYLIMAEEAAKKIKQIHFSCWRYCLTVTKDFLVDCNSIRNLFEGESVQPPFITHREPVSSANPER